MKRGGRHGAAEVVPDDLHPSNVTNVKSSGQANSDSGIGQMTLDCFATAGLVIAVSSHIPSEIVYFASDNAVISTDEDGHCNGRVLYRAAELKQLRRASEETLQLAHGTKKVFGGTVIKAQ